MFHWPLPSSGSRRPMESSVLTLKCLKKAVFARMRRKPPFSTSSGSCTVSSIASLRPGYSSSLADFRYRQWGVEPSRVPIQSASFRQTSLCGPPPGNFEASGIEPDCKSPVAQAECSLDGHLRPSPRTCRPSGCRPCLPLGWFLLPDPADCWSAMSLIVHAAASPRGSSALLLARNHREIAEPWPDAPRHTRSALRSRAVGR